MGYEISASVFNSASTLIPFNENHSSHCFLFPSSSSSSIFLPHFKHQPTRLVAQNLKPHTLLFNVRTSEFHLPLPLLFFLSFSFWCVCVFSLVSLYAVFFMCSRCDCERNWFLFYIMRCMGITIFHQL